LDGSLTRSFERNERHAIMTLENGILTITIPERAQAKARRVRVTIS
jgi:HSP20 family molecular chaperone IbpA